MTFRSRIERLSRNRTLKRRLPPRFGRARIYVSPDAALRFWMPGSGSAESMLFEAADARVREGAVVWDFGANVGLFSLAAARRAGKGGSVLAMEPDPFLASLLQRSVLDLPAGSAPTSVVCAAVADRTGLARFNIAERGRASNSLLETKGLSQTGGVRQTTLVPVFHPDELQGVTGPPDFIKIDVEGAELLILKALSGILDKSRCDLLIETDEARVDEATSLLRSHGYLLSDAERGFSNPEPIDRCAFNTFAYHEDRA